MQLRSLADWEELLRKAANNDVAAQKEAAFIFDNGLTVDNVEIVKIDKPSALYWIKKAHENGDIEATVDYADYLTSADDAYGEKDVEAGMRLYEKAMDQGNKRAAYHLGLEYRNRFDYEKAFGLYKQAQQSDEFFEQLTIGMCYYYGVGVVKDKPKALETFQKIDAKNVSAYELDEANYMIGRIYLEGEAVDKDIQKARHHLELADRDGDHRSAQEILLIIGRSEPLAD